MADMYFNHEDEYRAFKDDVRNTYGTQANAKLIRTTRTAGI